MGKTHAFICVSFFRPPEQGTYTIGPQRKGDDKPCVTNVTIITFGTFSRQTSPSSKQIFLYKIRTQKYLVKDLDKTRK